MGNLIDTTFPVYSWEFIKALKTNQLKKSKPHPKTYFYIKADAFSTNPPEQIKSAP